VDEWNAWRVQCKQEVQEQRKRGGKKTEAELHPHEEEKEEIEVWVDEVIEQTEEVVVE
jgi:translation initiation factor 3 subunit B